MNNIRKFIGSQSENLLQYNYKINEKLQFFFENFENISPEKPCSKRYFQEKIDGVDLQKKNCQNKKKIIIKT